MAKASALKLAISPLPAVVMAAYAALFTGLFHASLTQMISDWNREDYNYGYLIPLVALYLLWDKRQVLMETASTPSWWGLGPFLGGVFLYWLGELGGEFYALYLSSWLVLVGFCWLLIGWPRLKAIAFPLLLLVTMFPFPHFIHANASLKLQLLSSQLGTALMRLYGLTAFRDGNVIDLGFTRLQVVEACSGLRYLIPLVVLGLILVYFFKAPWWKRTILLVSTVPWAILVNAFRIALTGICASIWGVAVIEGFSHDLAAWVVFMASLGVLLVELWVLAKLPPHTAALPAGVQVDPQQGMPASHFPGNEASPHPPVEAEPAGKARQPGPGPTVSEEGSSGEKEPDAEWKGRETARRRSDGGRKSVAWLPHALVALFILAGTLGLSYGIDFRERIPPRKPLAQFPHQVGVWRGTPLFMDPEIIERLHLSSYLMMDYAAPGGKRLDFYVGYYGSQRKGRSIHTPATCLPAIGWVFEDSGLITFAAPGCPSGSLTVNRAFMAKTNQRQLVYYWFPQRGRILHSPFELKLYGFWDALTQQRTDGALVRLITPLSELEPAEAADQRLQEFARQVLPVLQEYLPGRRLE